jgi:hypothetical protein
VTIEFRTSGGVAYFPGLAAPVTFNTADMPADARAKLERLVEDAHFFDQPSDTPPPQRGADYQTHTITVKDGERTHTVRVSDPIKDPAMAALVAELQALRTAKSQARQSGSGS